MLPDEYNEWFKKRYKHTSSFFSGILLVFVDVFCIMLCFGVSFFIINLIDQSAINFKSFISYWIYLPAFILVFYGAHLYPGIMLAPADEVRRLALCSLACFSGIALSISVETDGRDIVSIALLLAIPIAIVLLPVGREIGRKLFCRLSFWGVPTVIYANRSGAEFLIDRLKKRKDFGYTPVLILNTGTENFTEYRGIPVLVPDDAIHAIIRKLNIKVGIIISRRTDDEFGIEPLSDEIMNMYRYTLHIPYIKNVLTSSVAIRDFGGILAFSATHNLTIKTNLFWKRCIDLFLIIVSLPVMLPVVAVIALGVKMSSPGAVFFGHNRIGYRGKPITTWKFRSMVNNAEEKLAQVLASDPQAMEQWTKNRKIENDPRITPFGKFIRKTSLDELPQLWNILKGEMSFVGPRPVTDEELINYGYKDKRNYVLSVKPGLSGMWQISGRSETGYEERILLDSYYIQNWSVWLDIWIIIQTVWVVFKGKGAY